MEKIRCRCGMEANVVECGAGAYVICRCCGAGAYMFATKGEAIKMFREKYTINGSAEAEVLAFAQYADLEKAADRTAAKIKEGFLEMGYILKVARDTDILAGSGYGSHEEFAEKRYGLDKGTVSRYIRIVERFSEGGDSCVLKENYKNIGFAKLSLMLHMPDAVAEEITERYSKQEVQEIKEEVEAEKAVSDIEVAIEAACVPPEERREAKSLLELAVRQLGREQQALYAKLWEADKSFTEAVRGARILETLAPQGDAIYMVRVPGVGRLMLSVSGSSASVTSVRGGEKEECSPGQVSAAVHGICHPAWTADKSYQDEYGEKMDGQAEAAAEPGGQGEDAPVQPKEKEKRKDSKVTKAKPPKKPSPQGRNLAPRQEPAPQNTEDAPVPGQMDVEEWLADVPEVSYREIQGEQEAGSTDKLPDAGGGSVGAVLEARRTAPPAFAGREPDALEQEAAAVMPEGARLEEEAYQEAARSLDFLKKAFTIWDWRAVPDDTLDNMLKEAVSLAAALEKMMEARGRHGEKHYA